MANEVRFDFLSTGAGRLAGDLRKTGDSAVLAARGAKVLADAIGTLGSKENRTAVESLTLARALRLTGDAEDRVTAKALAADAAVRRLSDAMGDSSAGRGVLGRLLLGAGGSGGGVGGLAGTVLGAGGIPGGLGTVVAGLAALPFAAQAAAGAITLALGGALTGIGILGASSAKRVKAAFAGLKTTFGTDLRQVAQPFVGALKQIAQVAQSVLPTIMLGLAGTMRTLAPPFKIFTDALLRAFAQPAVATSLQAVAQAFGAILKALAPQLGTDIKDVAVGIERIANTVSKNPGAFAAVISFFFKATGFALSMVAALASVANYIEKHFIPALMHIRKGWDDARHQTAVILDGMRHQVAHVWDMIFQNTIGTVIRLGHNVETQFNSLRHSVAVIFDNVRHDIASAWDTIWNNTAGRVKRGISDVVNWFKGLPGQVLGALRGLGTSLYAFGHAALTDLWNGLKSVGGSILKWAVSWVKSLPSLLMHALGMSPPHAGSVFYELGANIMRHLEAGIKSRAGSARSAAEGAIGGHGVAAHGPLQDYARKLLAAYGWGNQWAAFNDIVMMESGWNVTAVNSSSGAYGLPQALPGSKMASAGADWRTSGYTQLRWMMSYLASRWGSPANADRNEQLFHWYGSGLQNGVFTRPTVIGVGERGPELVNIRPLSGGGGAQTIVLEIAPGGEGQLTAALLQVLRKQIRFRGGGDVQIALGRP